MPRPQSTVFELLSFLVIGPAGSTLAQAPPSLMSARVRRGYGEVAT